MANIGVRDPVPLPARSSEFVRVVRQGTLNDVVDGRFDSLYDNNEDFRRYVQTEDDKTSKTGKEQFDRGFAAQLMEQALISSEVIPTFVKKTAEGELRRPATLRDIDRAITIAMARRNLRLANGETVNLSRRKRLALRVSLTAGNGRPDVTVDAVEDEVE